MDFLKEILGEELFNKFSEKINAYNGDENNKEKQVKLANLASGEYIGKGKYEALQALLEGKTNELDTANNLINDLKKSNKGNEDLQGKIGTYENQVQELQAQLEKTKLESAVKVALLEAKATDIDYLTFKLNQEGELKLDENGKIQGWEDKLSGLKTQFPSQFENGQFKRIEEHKLEENKDTNGSLTKQDLLKKPYAERVKFKEENPETYNELMKG